MDNIEDIEKEDQRQKLPVVIGIYKLNFDWNKNIATLEANNEVSNLTVNYNHGYKRSDGTPIEGCQLSVGSYIRFAHHDCNGLFAIVLTDHEWSKMNIVCAYLDVVNKKLYANRPYSFFDPHVYAIKKADDYKNLQVYNDWTRDLDWQFCDLEKHFTSLKASIGN
jgi:hypothetical protein